MPRLRRYRQHRSKPPICGTAIDWSRPLAQGLQGFYALNEGVGPAVADSADSLGLTASGFGATNPWAQGSYGACLSCSVTGAGFIATVPAAFQFSWPLTIAVAFRFLGNPTSVSDVFSIFKDNSTNIRVLAIDTTSGSTGINYVANGNTSFFSTSAIGTTADHVATLTVDSNGASGAGAAYLDGVVQKTGAVAGTPTWTATSPLAIGSCQPGLASRNANALIYWAAWWNRALSAADHAMIGRDPAAIFGQLFGATRPRWHFAHAAAAGATLVRRTLYDRAGSRGVA